MPAQHASSRPAGPRPRPGALCRACRVRGHSGRLPQRERARAAAVVPHPAAARAGPLGVVRAHAHVPGLRRRSRSERARFRAPASHRLGLGHQHVCGCCPAVLPSPAAQRPAGNQCARSRGRQQGAQEPPAVAGPLGRRCVRLCTAACDDEFRRPGRWREHRRGQPARLLLQIAARLVGLPRCAPSPRRPALPRGTWRPCAVPNGAAAVPEQHSCAREL